MDKMKEIWDRERPRVLKAVVNVVEDIEPEALDDSGLHIPREEIDKATRRIMTVFDLVFSMRG